MKTSIKAMLAGAALLLLGVLLLPRLARRIDSTLNPVWEKARAREAQYRDMTNAYLIASESSSVHPTRRLWEQRRAELLKSGYIETRELRLQHRLAAKGEVNAFFSAFQSRFPGIECTVRGASSDGPTVRITGRKIDFGTFGTIERFVKQYDPKDEGGSRVIPKSNR